MKERLRKIIESNIGKRVDKFCNSVWYIVAIGVVCVLCHSFDIPVVGAAFLTLLLVPALLFCKNSFVLAPFLMMCSFVISEDTMPQSGYYNNAPNISILCILLVLNVAALVINLIYYNKWKLIFKRAYLTVSLCLVTVLLVIGGVGAPSFSGTGVVTALSIAVTMFLPYAMLINCGEYNGRKSVEYFAWALITASAVIFAAVIKQYLKYDLTLSYHPKNLIIFGYAISNTGAAFVVIALPMTFYMVYRYKHGYAFLVAIAMELITIWLTFSRASIVVALPCTAIVAIALCFIKKNGRLGYWIAFGMVAVAVLAIVIAYRHIIFEDLSTLLDSDNSDSGRFALWKVGFEAWKEYPIFGLGIWYLPPINNWYYSFHNTVLTYLYCTGVVGLIGYLYHRYKTVRLVFSAKLTSERTFLALSILVMLCNALLDIAMTMPPHLLYYGIMLALIECDVRKVKAEQTDCIESASDEDNKTEPAVQNDGDTAGEISLHNTNNEEGKI